MLSFGSAGHWQCCIAPKAGALVVELDTATLDEHQASRPTIGWRLLSAQNDSASPGAGDDPAWLRDGPDAGAGAGGRRVSRH